MLQYAAIDMWMDNTFLGNPLTLGMSMGACLGALFNTDVENVRKTTHRTSIGIIHLKGNPITMWRKVLCAILNMTSERGMGPSRSVVLKIR